MSFGFSIGDIVLLSKIAYDLYTSVSAGRKAASRDLKELEDVLFSLRCALDHLGQVAQDVQQKSKTKDGGPDFLENLNRMINSCANTLKELDDVTKKYREVGIDDEMDPLMTKGGFKKKKTLDDQIQRLKVNWRKIRWDQEKQSLQTYREKLKTHTDAINIILTSIVWSNANNAESNSKTNHERTHTLLNQVLASPQSDTTMLSLLQDIHSHITKPTPQPVDLPVEKAKYRHVGRSTMMASGPAPSPAMSLMASVNTLSIGAPPAWGSRALPMGYTHPPRDKTSSFSSHHEDHFGHIMSESVAVDEPEFEYAAYRPEPAAFAYRISPESSSKPAPKPAPKQPKRPDHDLTPTLVSLNNRRRAVASKEFEAYKNRHNKSSSSARVPRPSAYIGRPNAHNLASNLSQIFRPIPKTESNKMQANEDKSIVLGEWISGFTQFVKEGASDGDEVDLLVALNKAMEESTSEVKGIFYNRADQAKLMDSLEHLQETTKSVRVMKEIEEFQDAREDWEDEQI